MDNELRQKLFKSFDKLRGNYPMRDTRFLDLVFSTLGKNKLTSILENVDLLQRLTNQHTIFIPFYILNFINEFIKPLKAKSHFDPWLSLSSPILHYNYPNSMGICKNQNEYEIIKDVFSENDTTIILGDNLSEINKLKSTYDLIISFPPFGMRSDRQEINGIKTPNDLSSILVIRSSFLLNENGKSIFLLPPSFLFDNKIRESLSKIGLFIDSVFSIPSGAFSPVTNISANLIVFSKKASEKSFVAEISPDESVAKTIINNYRNRKEGKAVQLGAMVDIKDFKSFKSLVAEKEMNELVKRIGFPAVNLFDIAISIYALKEENKDEIEHLPNSIYLPKIGNSPVVTNPSSMKMKNPKNYYRIQLDETKANSKYVANYLNSPIGLKLRGSLEVGTVILLIPKSQLANCILYLPDIKTQSELVNIDGKIDQFSLRLDELKRDLWKQPKVFPLIAKELKSINQEEKLEHWIDSLPFPVSSILWRYYATKDNGKKVEHLFHFFEGFSEFLSMVMLSAFVQDKEFYKQECHKWIDSDEKFREWYFRATFGNWNVLSSKLSKATREYFNDKEKQELCRSLYGNPNDSFLKVMSSKGIINILMAVSELRNKWKGHGGITSEEDNNQRVTILGQQLNDLRKFIADGFIETRIISPNTSSYEDGIFSFNAKELVGARTPFNEITIKSLIPLDKKKLYLFHSNQNKPVELLPFIKFIESTDAVYFYTSIESKNVRWISYHFDKNPELSQPVDADLFKAFEFLKINKNM